MNLAGKTVLVTGATGFLGGTLALRLASDGARVRGLARTPEKGAFLGSSVELVQGDVTDIDTLRRAVEGCAVVFHTAVSYNDLAQQRAVNVEGTRLVAKASAEAGVDRFIHVSSIAAYGYKIDGEITEETPSSPAPHDPYSITKVEAEKAVQSVAAAHHLPYTIIRPAMIYGPRSQLWTENLFRLARLKVVPFLGSGDSLAHPIHVDDVVDLMTIVATHPRALGEVFNCAPDPAPTWRAWLGGYARLAGHQRWLSIPPALVQALAGGIAFAAPQGRLKELPDIIRMLRNRTLTYKMAKARDWLGWQPKVDLETGIASCVPWLRERGLLT